MKVAMWYNNRDIRIEEFPTPHPGPGEMLVKVHSCGICGSDVVEWYRLPRAPLVQGHEIGAEVVEVGSGAERYRPGDRVFIAPKVPCLECEDCRRGHHPVCSAVKERLPGGFAEYILAPAALVERGTVRLPDNMSYDESTFIEPLACVVRAQRLAGVKEARRLLILGCGMSGLMHVKLARASSDCVVAATDINPKKRDLARRLGAQLVLEADEDVPARMVGGKADAVLLCTSALPAVEQAWRSVGNGGTIVFFAVPEPDKTVVFPANDFWRREIRVLTTYYCGPEDIAEALTLIAAGRVEVEDLITHRLPLRDIREGFRLVIEGREAVKVIIKPHEEV